MAWIRWLNNHILWGLPMVLLLLGTGVFLTVATRGLLFRRFGTLLRCTLGSLVRKPPNTTATSGGITPFQAVCTALAGTVGTGNIVGVALAIAVGGPGAVFWLWVSALVGMVVKYSEVTLAVAHRTVNARGETVGGPMYYIARCMGKRWPAMLFAGFGCLASFGIGAAVQANSLATNIHASFPAPTPVIGVVAAALAALILIGGIRRIARVTEVLVPFMAVLYIGGAVAVLCCHFSAIPAAFKAIFRDAFTGTAAAGGFLGASAKTACRVGMARGVFTHEAGMGSAPIAHASANTDHPARQGLWGAFEVCLDSLVLCTVTALVILTSGLWQDAGLRQDAGTMSATAFAQAFAGGQYIVAVSLPLFAFATVVAWYYYGEQCVNYLFRHSLIATRLYQLLYVVLVYVGCVMELETVWAVADLFNALMALPNLAALLLLAPTVRRLTEEFFHSRNK